MQVFVYKLITAASLLLSGTIAIYGVPEDEQSLYKADKDGNWACLGHPDIVISFDKVNDDWCDCPDGSDEPGTGACSNGYFFCENKGHIARWIPSSLVGDGICDASVCCDGSDENSVGHIQCPNVCADISRQYRDKLELDTEKWQQGYAIKQELISEAKGLKDALQKSIETKEHEYIEVEGVLPTYEQALLDAQRADKESGSQEEQLPQEIANAKEIASKVQDKLNGEISSLAAKLGTKANKLNELLETMKTDYNPNFNDPAVKAAIRGWEEVQASSEDGSEEADLSEQLVVLSRIVADIGSELDKFEPDIGTERDSFAYRWIPAGLHQYLDSSRVWLEQNGILAVSKGKNRHEGRLTSEARTNLEVIQNKLKDIEQSIQDSQAELNREYGPDDVLRPLKDVCIENPIGEYNYKVCFFGTTSQTGHGQHDTNLGRFSNVDVDLDNNEKLTINYDNGAKCWNGPIRSSHVEVTCGSENKILSVTEPERCEYFFLVQSPAGCSHKSPSQIAEAEQQAHLSTHALSRKYGKEHLRNEGSSIEHSDL